MTYKKAKKKAWYAFSLYIRTRDALETTGDTENFICYTCGRVVPVKGNDAGHAIPGRRTEFLFDESIVKGQCTRCNRDMGGMYEAFKENLIRDNGEKWYRRKLIQKHSIKKLSSVELLQIAEYYKTMTEELWKQSNQ